MAKIYVLKVYQGRNKNDKPYKSVRYIDPKTLKIKSSFCPPDMDLEPPSPDYIEEVLSGLPNYDVEYDSDGNIIE